MSRLREGSLFEDRAEIMEADHISVCICTYKRARALSRLLEVLRNQITGELFRFSIIIVDNDLCGSAREIASAYKENGLLEIDYYVEPHQSIPMARNKAVENVKGNYFAFIDDDEIPIDTWLLYLYKTCIRYNADGVLGPVKPIFEEKPPDWITKCKLFERPSYKTGTTLRWKDTRTGNVLMRKRIIENEEVLFNPEFRHSEDQEFFRRMTGKGHTFVWCNEAIVYEIETADRWRKMYFLKRALLRGNVSLRLQSKRKVAIVKSAIAFSIYTFALPFLFVISRRLFLIFIIKDADHVGRLLSALGFDVQDCLA